ncbi:DsbA family oxidoreductase [Phytohabitans sp. ZYX-F-186]|uniref:DsbA family oxidoreductase n=1 Tax=Phytohabitans maris TaxID=3071409 RepID=A0ABU0ZVS1_9ACTN|nr:DsbA family oxidoreductase [Phytohabitans sp. ZYX-F-186]MDQ7910607.1 DsbA family oxidoreductase [Phytohabitans sp. ZYX-F-186]
MKIEVWSDVVCPWCYIGKRRLQNALARFDHAGDVEVTWRSFQLDPSQPRGENQPTTDMISGKYGVPPAQAKAMQDRVTGLAAEEGLTYHLDRSLTANTFDAHRLTHFAASRDLADGIHERLFQAALVEGEAVDDTETLVRIGTGAGLPADEVRKVLDSDAYADEVRDDIRQARALGANGVPFFVFDRTYGISGAQPIEVFLATLEKAAS